MHFGEIGWQLEANSVRATEACIKKRFTMKHAIARPVVTNAQYKIAVVEPYRLDLTVSVLRRLSTNIVDVFTADGHYVRAFGGVREPLVARVTQHLPDTLAVSFKE